MKAMSRYVRKIICLLQGVLLAFVPVACIYEDMEPCPVEVRFVYDYNMEFADGFPQQVKEVTLYIYGPDGQLVDTYTARTQDVFSEGYRMSLEGLEPGTYTLVAWASDTDDQEAQTRCYTFENPLIAQSRLTDMNLSLNLEASDYPYDQQLVNLWHGMVSDFIVTGTEPTLVTVSLVQDVKRFRVMLQASDGRRLEADDYSVGIEAANYRLNYDNSLLPCPVIEYRPYWMQEATIDNEASSTRDTGDLNVLVAELNTLRLMTDEEARFTVCNERNGKTLFDINLIRYLELMRLDRYHDMPLQEYLDRENSYQIILLVGQDEHVISIQINAWILVLNESEL